MASTPRKPAKPASASPSTTKTVRKIQVGAYVQDCLSLDGAVRVEVVDLGDGTCRVTSFNC